MAGSVLGLQRAAGARDAVAGATAAEGVGSGRLCIGCQKPYANEASCGFDVFRYSSEHDILKFAVLPSYGMEYGKMFGRRRGERHKCGRH